MQGSYDAKCPKCESDVYVADQDCMGFPSADDEDPLFAYCHQCKTPWRVVWKPELHPVEEDECEEDECEEDDCEEDE